jgi:ABC-type branched-subunit amino acid transport system ATPase component
MSAPKALLEATSLEKRFGGLVALRELSFTVAEAEIVGLVGPNGAGKSTLLHLLSGRERVSSGEIRFQGVPVTDQSEPTRARAGIVRVFQDLANLDQLSLRENIEIGLCARPSTRSCVQTIQRALSSPSQGSWEPDAADVCSWLGLDAAPETLAKELSHWQKRLLSFGRALAGRPRLLLLDEPFAGLSFRETRTLIDLTQRLRAEQGRAFVLVEHNLDAVLQLCDRVLVLHLGQKIADAEARSILSNQRVIDVYLGAG